MRHFKRWLLLFVFVLFALVSPSITQAGQGKLNVLLITLDDMNYDSLGVTGCKVKNISPNIDKLARQGMLFTRAHVTIAVCQPTRAVWMTGLYPHKNGARGFEPISKEVKNTLPQILRQHGYFLGLFGKEIHVVPSRRAAWNTIVSAKDLMNGRGSDLYYKHAKEFFAAAKKAGQPFFLMANAHDPHRPFAGSDQEKNQQGKRRKNFPEAKDPYLPKDVTVPGFLPKLKQIRLEMAEYYTSVHRADATVGALLKALEESGMSDNTVVIFLSDHGMPLPFAKTNCYYHSTRTPLIVRWPETVRPDSKENDHFVSGIDMMPTILDITGVECPTNLDGRSFVPLLKGEKQKGRDRLITVFHKTSGRKAFEMRAAHDPQYLYIYNGWADGKTVFRNESQSGRTMKAMVNAAKNNPEIAARVELFLKRVPEELFDYQKDPDCLHNLINDPNYASVRESLRSDVERHLREINDPLLADFRKQVQR